MLLEHHHLERALKTTGIPFKFAHNVSHWNIVPVRNFDTWTVEQQTILEETARKIGGIITRTLVLPNFSTFVAKPGRGFRVYTSGGYNTLNKEGYREVCGES